MLGRPTILHSSFQKRCKFNFMPLRLVQETAELNCSIQCARSLELAPTRALALANGLALATCTGKLALANGKCPHPNLTVKRIASEKAIANPAYLLLEQRTCTKRNTIWSTGRSCGMFIDCAARQEPCWSSAFQERMREQCQCHGGSFHLRAARTPCTCSCCPKGWDLTV